MTVILETPVGCLEVQMCRRGPLNVHGPSPGALRLLVITAHESPIIPSGEACDDTVLFIIRTLIKGGASTAGSSDFIIPAWAPALSSGPGTIRCGNAPLPARRPVSEIPVRGQASISLLACSAMCGPQRWQERPAWSSAEFSWPAHTALSSKPRRTKTYSLRVVLLH